MVRPDRPSKSARDVAAACAMRGAHPRYEGIAPPGLPAQLGSTLLTSGAIKSRQGKRPLSARGRRLRKRLFHGFMDLYERTLLPGMSAHLLVRKRFVEDQVRAAIGAGARQLVVLGAGYDLVGERALRDHPDLAVLEVDHPPTQELKRRAYAVHVGGGPVLVPLDLMQTDLGSVLSECQRFTPGALSVFVAEGLVMYLSKEDVLGLLETFVAMTAPGSRLVLTHCTADNGGRACMGRFPRVLRGLSRLAGEPLLWGVSREDLPAFAALAGLRVRSQPSREDLEREYLPQRDHPLLTMGTEPFAVLEH